jgi:hypothetical protein
MISVRDIKIRSPFPMRGVVWAALAVAFGLSAISGPAQAREDQRDNGRREHAEGDRNRGDRNRGERHGWNGGYYRAPPPVYVRPYGGYGYAPPPVVYGPGVGLNLFIR